MSTNQLFSALFILLFSCELYAQTNAVEVKLLSGIYAEAVKDVKTGIDSLSELKATSDTIMQTRQILSDVREEYEFVTTFNPEAELNNIISDIDGLTNVNELVQAKSFDEKWNLLYGEVDKRFKESDKNSKTGIAAGNAKHALEELKAMEALQRTYTNAAISPDPNASTKDLQRGIASATAMSASLALEQKISATEERIRRTQRVMSGLEWDAEFQSYLSATGAGAMASGPITGFLVNVLNPSAIYEGMFKLTALISFIPWIIVFVVATRHAQESSASMVGKAGWAKALMSTNRMTFTYLVYSAVGFGFFGLILTFASLFNEFGSEQLISDQLLSLRSALDKPVNYDKDYLQRVLEVLVDEANIFSTGFLFLLYQGVSVVYVGVSRFIDVLFAVFVAVAYAWGFFAIGSMALKEPLNMVSGWIKNIAGLFVWAILIPFLSGILWIMAEPAGKYVQQAYGGFGAGLTSLGAWSAYACVVMVFMLILKIMAIAMSARLVSNQAMQGEFAKAAAIVAGVAGLKALESAKDGSKDYAKSMMPNIKDGNRWRDGAGQKVADFFGKPAQEAVASAATGAKDIARRLTGWESAPRTDAAASAGGNAPNNTAHQQARPSAQGATQSTSTAQGQGAEGWNSATAPDAAAGSPQSTSATRGADSWASASDSASPSGEQPFSATAS